MTFTKLSDTNAFDGPQLLIGFKNPINKERFVKAIYNSIYHSNPFYKEKEEILTSGFQRRIEDAKKGCFTAVLSERAYYLTESPSLRFTFFEGNLKNLLVFPYHFVGISYEYQFKPFGSPKSIALFLQKIKELIEALQPAYAGGDAGKIINKATGKDPRQYCWAYNYFSPELLATIGRGKLEKLVAVNNNWRLEELSTGGVLFQLAEPFNQNRFKEYTTYKRQAEKILNLKKLFGGKKSKPVQITRESYGRGEMTRAGNSETFDMLFAVEKGILGKEEYLTWLSDVNKEFRGTYHDSLLEEWAEMFANGNMNEGISLRDIIFDMEVLESSGFGETYQHTIFITASVGLSLFDDCDCEDPGKHGGDCEQQQNIRETLHFFTLAIKHLDPRCAILGHEAEIAALEEHEAHLEDFLFPLTYISRSRFVEIGINPSQLKSPIIKVKNGIVLDNFSGVFEFEGEDEFEKRKKHDAGLLGLRDIEEMI